MKYLIAFLLMALPAQAQPLWRNFFTTNQNPRVIVAAGSNVTVQASTVGVDQRIFTVNANLNPTNIPPLNYISNNVGFGTNTTIVGTLNASNEVLTLSGVGTTISPIVWLTNGTAASLGAQQASPALMLGGQGWRSGNSTTMPVQMGMYVLPVQGSSANPTARLTIMQSISNAAPTSTGTYFDNDGYLTTANTITSGNHIGLASGSQISWASRVKLFSTADGIMQALNSASSGFIALILGPNTDNWLRLKVEQSTNNPTLSIRTGADGNYAALVSSNHIIPIPNLGTTIQPALWLTNSTDAALGAQQASPALMLGGQGWRSGNSTTMPVQMGMYVQPVQGSSANPGARLTIMQSVSNAAPASTGTYFADTGAIVAGNSISSGAHFIMANSGNLYAGSRSIFSSPVDGLWQAWNSSQTAFSGLILGPNSDNWLRLKVEASTNNPTFSFRTGADGNYASLVASNVFGVFAGATQPLHAHASLMMIGDETVDLVAQSTYYAVTNFDATVTNLMGASVTAGTITNYLAGWYNVRMNGSGLGTTANSELYECGIFTNNVECTLIEWQRSVSSTARGSFAAEGTIYLPAGCWINARIKSDAASPDDFTFGRFTLTVSSP